MGALKWVGVSAATGLLLFAAPSMASASTCDQAGYHAVRTFPDGVFMSRTAGEDDIEHVYVCSPSYGVQVKVGRFDFDPDFVFWGRGVARGRTAAWATAEGEEEGSVYLDLIHKADLATGKRFTRSAVDWPATYSDTERDYTGALRSVAMNVSGDVAWMVDYRKHHRTVREIHLWDANGTRIVSTSLVTTPKYLAYVLGVNASEVAFSKRKPRDWPIDTEDSAP